MYSLAKCDNGPLYQATIVQRLSAVPGKFSAPDRAGGLRISTLNEFTRQAGLQVLFDFKVLGGMKTHAVNGDLDPSTALALMLNGTNLTFDFVML